MPPKARITRDMILDAAFELIRAEGHQALNVRTLAGRLGCSTQPILYNFPTMDALKDAVYEKADRFHTAYILPREGEGPDALLLLGLNYVRFGYEERQLFRFLFESNRFGGMDMNALVRGPEVGELVAILASGGFMDSITEVLTVAIENKPGAVNRVLQLLADAGIGVKYIYSTIQSAKGEAAITMKTTDQKRAENILTNAGVKLCTMEDLK